MKPISFDLERERITREFAIRAMEHALAEPEGQCKCGRVKLVAGVLGILGKESHGRDFCLRVADYPSRDPGER